MIILINIKIFNYSNEITFIDVYESSLFWIIYTGVKNCKKKI